MSSTPVTPGPCMGLFVRLIVDQARSEDIVQQAFINVWRAAAGYHRERGPATGWLFAIARNAAFDALRSREAPSRWRYPICRMKDPAPTSGPRRPSRPSACMRLSTDCRTVSGR